MTVGVFSQSSDDSNSSQISHVTTEQLETLKGIVFLVPQNTYLSGSAIHSNPPVCPQTIQLKNYTGHSFKSHSQEVVLFLFNNQQVLSWAEVRSRGLIKKIPPQLNPDVRAQKKEEAALLQKYPWWLKDKDDATWWKREFEKGSLSLLEDMDLIHRLSIEFYLGWFPDSLYSQLEICQILSIDHTSINTADKVLKIETTATEQVILRQHLDFVDLQSSYYFEFGVFSLLEKKLYFGSFESFQELKKATRSISIALGSYSGSVVFNSASLVFKNQSDFEYWTYKIQNTFFKLNPQWQYPISYRSIDDTLAAVSIHPRQQEFAIWRDLYLQNQEQKSIFHESIYCHFAKVLQNGAWNELIGSKEYEVSSRYRKYRQNDLRFLRHQGGFAYFLLETIHYFKFKKVLDPNFEIKNTQNFLDYLMPKLKQFVFLDASEEFLFNLVSPGILKLIEKTVHDVSHYSQNRCKRVILQSDSVIFADINEFCELDLLLADLMTLAQTKGKSIFSKSSDKLFQYLPSVQIAVHQPSFKQNLPFADFVSLQSVWIDQLRQQGFQIYFNDSVLSLIEPEDLDFELSFKESVKGSRWFEMDPRIYFKGQEIQLADSFQIDQGYIIIYQNKPYLIDGKLLPKYDNILKIWEKLFAAKSDSEVKNQSSYLLPQSAKIELLSLILNGVRVHHQPDLQHIANYLKAMDRRQGLLSEVIEKDTNLMSYQKLGVQWLWDMYNLKLGCVLADEMGLGKTVQAIKFIAQIPQNNKPHLIVVPATLVYNWKSEFEKFAPHIQTLFISSRSDLEQLKLHSSVVGLVSYGMLTEHKDRFLSQEWGLLVFDEAHQLKNKNTQRYKVAFDLKADYKLALSGTPFENHVGELSSVLSLVLQGHLEQWNDKVKDDLEYLKKIIKPFVLRRTKSEVQLQLPDKIEETVVLPTNDNFRKVYRETASILNQQVIGLIDKEGEGRSQIHILAALTKLRQLCSDPKMVDENITDSPKLEFLFEKIQEGRENGESILVFSQFLNTINRIEKELLLKSINVLRIDGSTPQKKRIEIIEKFQNSTEPEILLLTLKTGGVGLNLTKASLVFHIDPWWNPAVENQATDRAHRIGQKKTVQSFRLILKDTLEERIQQMKIDKQNLFERVFSNQKNNADKSDYESPTTMLTRQDFEFLVPIPPTN